MENKSSVYREKSLERVSSPEQLNTYIRVVKPSVWVIMVSIAIFLIGAVVFCAIYKLETETIDTVCVVKNNEVTMYIAGCDNEKVKEGMTMHIVNDDYIVPDGDREAVKLFALTDAAIIDVIGDTESEYAYKLKFNASIPNGVYKVTVVANQVTPLSLIMN